MARQVVWVQSANVVGIPLGLNFGNYPDGFIGSPAGVSPQYPALLNSYGGIGARQTGLINGTQYQPPWHVAGVDYGVGYPAAQVLTDWRTYVAGKAGVSITGSSSPFLIRVDNTSNVIFDSVDFSTSSNGYATLAFITSPSGSITNCKFSSNYSNSTFVINADANSPSLTVKYCIIDGGCITPGGAGTQSSLINAGAKNGTIVLQYNWFKNYGQQIVDLNYGGTTLDYRFNLIDNGNIFSGSHQNYQQWAPQSGNTTAIVQFNTSLQNTLGGAEGYQWNADDVGSASITLTNPVFAYNTMIALKSGGSATMSYMVHGSGDIRDNAVTLSGSPVVHDNYFDMSGTLNQTSGAFYPSGGAAGPVWGGWVLSNNTNMVTGGSISNTP